MKSASSGKYMYYINPPAERLIIYACHTRKRDFPFYSETFLSATERPSDMTYCTG
jgi:hypothetical protein